MKTILWAAIFLALGCGCAQAALPLRTPPRPSHFEGPASGRAPWIEGVTPTLENRLFASTYKVLPSHNVLKVYVFDAGGYESAGIRFSARVPHRARDLSDEELDREAASLIRSTFDGFPEIETVDVWATIPVSTAKQTSIESTVFSVSADRSTYEAAKSEGSQSPGDFLRAFGRVWMSPDVPR